jgi:hypothetical protein
VRLADVGSFDGAFVTNAHGLATVAGIDDVRLPTNAPLLQRAAAILAAAPSDPI